MSARGHGRRALAAALAAAALAGCAEVQNLVGDYAKDTGKQVAHNAASMAVEGDLSKGATLSAEDEFRVGETAAATLVARAGKPLPPSHATAQYVRYVGAVLATAATDLRVGGDRPYPLKGYRFILVDSPAVNAAGTPGGFVVVTTGAVRACRSEDELAGILAHEIGHVQKGHASDQVEASRKTEQMKSGLLKDTGAAEIVLGAAVDGVMDVAYVKGYGRERELQADAFGARLLAAAGYDPRALAAVLSRLEGKAAQGGTLLSRHPAVAERVQKLGALDLGASPDAAPRLPRFAAARRALPAARP